MSHFETFLEKAKQVHGDKYDYSRFEYINAKTPGIIVCPVDGHGEFLQKPDRHTRVGSLGCPKCVCIRKAENLKARVLDDPDAFRKPWLTPEEYTTRFQERHGGTFSLSLSKYVGLTEGLVELKCDKHGSSEYSPRALLISKYGCRHCAVEQAAKAKTSPWEKLCEELESLYPGAYEYPSSNQDTYVNKRSTLEVVCPNHGVFHKKAQKLLSGQKCYECTLEEGILNGRYPGGYGYDLFERNPDLAASPGVLYYLKLDELYKIGITAGPVAQRVRSLKCSAKTEGGIELTDVRVLQEIRTTLGKAYEVEQRILREYASERVARRWSTELFRSDILADVDLEHLLSPTYKHSPTSTTPAILSPSQ